MTKSNRMILEDFGLTEITIPDKPNSDLMIRRIMRAITEEHLPQSWINIVFVSTEKVDEEGDFWTSKVEPLKLDERGVVSNWPKGFLDDDENETKALMKALYGDRFKEEEDASHE